jgi:hypothetical protein
MKTAFLTLTVAAVAVGFTLPSEEAAAASNYSGSHVSHNSGSSYRTFNSHGRNFSFRTYDRGYSGWSRYCWFPSYSCYGYYSPTDSSWYYYSGQYSCYMPVSYMSTFAPATVNANANANANANTNTNTNVNINTTGLPVGGTAIPAGVVPPLAAANAAAVAPR